MLGKMILHGLVAAAIIGAAAAVYAKSATDGTQVFPVPAPASGSADASKSAATSGNGYLQAIPGLFGLDGMGGERAERGERHEGHRSRHKKDDDED